MRTTINISKPILDELKRLQRAEKRPLGDLASELLAEALANRKRPSRTPPFRWISRDMRPLVDISDKDELYAALDEDLR